MYSPLPKCSRLQHICLTHISKTFTSVPKKPNPKPLNQKKKNDHSIKRCFFFPWLKPNFSVNRSSHKWNLLYEVLWNNVLVQKSNTAQRNVGRRATTETKTRIWAPAEQKQEPFTWGEPTQLLNARCCVDGKAIKWLFPYGSGYIVIFIVGGRVFENATKLCKLRYWKDPACTLFSCR